MPPLTERLGHRGLAPAAPLGGATGIHLHDVTSGAFSFLTESCEEHAPPVIVNRPCQHADGQPLDIQVFDRDQAEAVDGSCRLVVDVIALGSDVGVCLLEQHDGFPPSVAPTLATGNFR